jgi:hypothetical protein
MSPQHEDQEQRAFREEESRPSNDHDRSCPRRQGDERAREGEEARRAGGEAEEVDVRSARSRGAREEVAARRRNEVCRSDEVPAERRPVVEAVHLIQAKEPLLRGGIPFSP